MRVDFSIIQTKISQDNVVDVPDEIAKQGTDAIKDWLINNGHYENALDYAETNSKMNILVDPATRIQ
jgi:valyl-tRNA synthetase